jgi:hypothetical protein
MPKLISAIDAAHNKLKNKKLKIKKIKKLKKAKQKKNVSSF